MSSVPSPCSTLKIAPQVAQAELFALAQKLAQTDGELANTARRAGGAPWGQLAKGTSLAGKSTGNHGFSHEIWAVPASRPLNHSNFYWIIMSEAVSVFKAYFLGEVLRLGVG